MKLIPKFQEGSVLEDPNTKEIANYIMSYIQSPVFSKRLQTTYNIPTAKEWGMDEPLYNLMLDSYKKRNFINPNNVSPTFNLTPPKIKYINLDRSSCYHQNTHTVYLKSPNYYNRLSIKTGNKNIKNIFDIVGAHEITHSFDLPSKVQIEYGDFPLTVNYSNTIPAFRLMHSDFSTIIPNTDLYGSVMLPYETNHDNYPYEKYAELMAARYAAYKHGIFDSREDKEITRDQVKKLLKYIDYDTNMEGHFTEEELYWLLNNVADNSKYKNSKKDNLISEDIVQKYLT